MKLHDDDDDDDDVEEEKTKRDDTLTRMRIKVFLAPSSLIKSNPSIDGRVSCVIVGLRVTEKGLCTIRYDTTITTEIIFQQLLDFSKGSIENREGERVRSVGGGSLRSIHSFFPPLRKFKRVEEKKEKRSINETPCECVTSQTDCQSLCCS